MISDAECYLIKCHRLRSYNLSAFELYIASFSGTIHPMLRANWPGSKPTLLFFSGLLLCVMGATLAIANFWWQTHLPGKVYLDGVNLSHQNIELAKSLYANERPQINQDPTIIISSGLVGATASAGLLGITQDANRQIEQIYLKWQNKPWWEKVAYSIDPNQKIDEAVSYQVDQTKFVQVMKKFESQINIKPKRPTVTLGTNGQIKTLKVFKGEPGQEIDVPASQIKIIQALENNQGQVELATKLVGEVWDDAQAEQVKNLAAKLVGKNISLVEKQEYIKKEISDKQLVEMIGINPLINLDKLNEVVTQIAQTIDRPPQNATFKYDPDILRVTEFVPDKSGLGVNREQISREVQSRINAWEANPETKFDPIVMVMEKTTADVTLGSTNNLGIESLIGYGESRYAHSIPTRVYNVSLATSRVNDYLVPPDSEFSFNKAIGDVTKETGFKQAYIIQNGQTVLGDGGGVCQVSTTLFRALLNAGLPITRRVAHSYRVSYYELDSKPGVDATVFSGNTDLRFKNDTGHYVLIHGAADPKSLFMYFELYGTDSGRRGEIVNHTTYDYRPAPAPIYIPDPSLPPGTKKQIDFAASGIKAKFTNRVRDKNGNIIREDTYASNYQPWAAKYLVGQ